MAVFKRGARYKARRRAVDVLFEAETRDMDPVAVVDDRAQLAENPLNQVAPIAPYTRQIISGVAEKLDDIDDAIERNLSSEWKLHRLPVVDRQILRVAVWEIMFNEEVDAAVAISNAAELASEYSGPQASPYIHAIVDGVVQKRSPDAPFEEDSDEAAVDD